MESEQVQRSPFERGHHTYTPKSHEDLLQNHMRLDADRKTKFDNDIRKYKAEKEALQRRLERVDQELKIKDDEIQSLKEGKSKFPLENQGKNVLFEVDGQPINIDDLLKHFNAVIGRHHDVINKKNKQIQELKHEENRQPRRPKRPSRDEEANFTKYYAQSMKEVSSHDMEDYAQQLAQVRKDYDEAESILTERNKKLEALLKDLTHKLDQNDRQNRYLKNELMKKDLAQQKVDNVMQTVKEKEKENEKLKDIISSLQRQKHQGPNVHIMNHEHLTNNEDLKKEILNIIEDKKNTVNKLNSVISDLRKEPSKEDGEDSEAKPDFTEIEKECLRMSSDLSNLNEQLNNMIKRIQTSPDHLRQSGTLNKDDLISDLEKIKKQCQDEINILENKVKNKSPADMVIMTGQAIVKIDDSNTLSSQHETNSLENKLDNKKPTEMVIMRGKAVVKLSDFKSLSSQDETDILQNKISNKSTKDIVMMKSQSLVQIDDPNIIMSPDKTHSLENTVSIKNSKDMDIMIGKSFVKIDNSNSLRSPVEIDSLENKESIKSPKDIVVMKGHGVVKIHDPNNVKNQDETDSPENNVRNKIPKDIFIMSGQGVVKTDYPHSSKRITPQSNQEKEEESPHSAEENVHLPSNIKFIIDPNKPPKPNPKEVERKAPAPVYRYVSPPTPEDQNLKPESKYNTYRPYKRSVSTQSSKYPENYKSVSNYNLAHQHRRHGISPVPEDPVDCKSSSYRISDVNRSQPFSNETYTIIPCEACSEGYTPQPETRSLKNKTISLIEPDKDNLQGSKKKGGLCCTSKSSKTSNIPYSKEQKVKKKNQRKKSNENIYETSDGYKTIESN